jgi:hypothetical protein
MTTSTGSLTARPQTTRRPRQDDWHEDTQPHIGGSRDSTEEITVPMSERSHSERDAALPPTQRTVLDDFLQDSPRSVQQARSRDEQADLLVARSIAVLHDAIDEASDEIARVFRVPITAGRRTDNGLRPERELETLYRLAVALRDHALEGDLELIRRRNPTLIELDSAVGGYSRDGHVTYVTLRQTGREMVEALVAGETQAVVRRPVHGRPVAALADLPERVDAHIGRALRTLERELSTPLARPVDFSRPGPRAHALRTAWDFVEEAADLLIHG